MTSHIFRWFHHPQISEVRAPGRWGCGGPPRQSSSRGDPGGPRGTQGGPENCCWRTSCWFTRLRSFTFLWCFFFSWDVNFCLFFRQSSPLKTQTAIRIPFSRASDFDVSWSLLRMWLLTVYAPVALTSPLLLVKPSCFLIEMQLVEQNRYAVSEMSGS